MAENESEHEHEHEQGGAPEGSEGEHHEHEHESDDEQCDEAIAGLLDTIGQLEADNAELRRRIEQLEQRADGHESGFKHEPVPAAAPEREPEPEPRHWYFKRVGKQ